MKKINDFSIGVDIESATRFKGLQKTRSSHFLAKIFTKAELDYCFSKKASWPHLAARFAAKEAILKAVSPLSKNVPALNEIEITNNAKGVPTASLKGYNIKISLSHCEALALAFAVVEKR